MQKKHSQRKTIRLPRDCYRGGDPFFVTLCSEGRKMICPEEKETIIRFLDRQSDKGGGPVKGWVIMPDHVHFLFCGNADLVAWVACFKSAVVTSLKRRGLEFSWQRSFYDRGIRPGESLEDVGRYMLENPVRAELCRNYDEWPWSYMSGIKAYLPEKENG